MYNCGPTVYNYATIGNFRTFLFADLLRRTLEYQGYAVTQVMNITDVGHLVDDADEGIDKVEEAARQAKTDPYQITRRHEQFFLEDAQALRILPAHHYPRATEHISEIIDLIGRLIEHGHAYVVDSEVYYDVSSFSDYGQLSGNRPEHLMAGARVAVNEKKRSPLDFALWKADAQHLMQWDSPWGSGFPGWHVECSAMAMKYLGGSLDIHTGGEDNVFPHHECEIAQSEGASGQPFVRYWLHSRFLLVNGEKMSKSRGNYYTVRDLLAQGHTGRTLRYTLMSTPYRQSLNFTLEGLAAAANSLERIDDFVRRLRESNGASASPELDTLIAKTRQRFDEGICDDLNIAKALAAIFDLVREGNKMKMGQVGAEAVLGLLSDLDGVLGFLDVTHKMEEAPSRIVEMAQSREQARRDRDFGEADRLREAIGAAGWLVEDTPNGPRLKKSPRDGGSNE